MRLKDYKYAAPAQFLRSTERRRDLARMVRIIGYHFCAVQPSQSLESATYSPKSLQPAGNVRRRIPVIIGYGRRCQSIVNMVPTVYI